MKKRIRQYIATAKEKRREEVERTAAPKNKYVPETREVLSGPSERKNNTGSHPTVPKKNPDKSVNAK